MADEFTVKAQQRTDLGKGASRRLRRAGKLPAVVYGVSEPLSITLSHNEMLRHTQDDGFFSRILELEIDGSKDTQQVIVRDMQRHPARPFITHVDFQRVKKGQEFTTSVPLRFINMDEAVGVKEQGCFIFEQETELQIACTPANLPEFIEVDTIDMEDGDTIMLSDLVLPEGVRSIDLTTGEGQDLVIAACLLPADTTEEDEETEEVVDEAEDSASEEEDSSEAEDDN